MLQFGTLGSLTRSFKKIASYLHSMIGGHKYARRGLVVGSEQVDGNMYVYTADGKRLRFADAQRSLATK